MGTTMWCRNCGRNTNHSGMSGNFWKVDDTGDTVLTCHNCGHLRTRNTPELSEGTVITMIRSEKTKTLSRDGFLTEGGE